MFGLLEFQTTVLLPDSKKYMCMITQMHKQYVVIKQRYLACHLNATQEEVDQKEVTPLSLEIAVLKDLPQKAL